MPSLIFTENKKTIGIGVIALIVFLGGIFLFFIRGGERVSQGQSITIAFKKSGGQLYVGQPFSLGISFANVSRQILDDAILSVVLPEDILLVGQHESQRNIEETVGELTQGSEGQRNFDLIAVGGGRTLKKIEARLTYSMHGSKAKFEQQASIDLAIGQPAVSFTFDVPENIVSGETFDLIIRYRNNTSDDFKDMRLAIDYPTAFQLKKSDPEPRKGTKEWTIETLPSLKEGAVTVTGSLIGPEQSFFGFRARLLGDFFGQEYAIYEQAVNVAIAISPISLSIVANNDQNYIGAIGDSITYTITYRNTSGITFDNLTIRAHLTGELFDFSTVNTPASFSSITNTLTWLTANSPPLVRLGPQEEGSVSVTIGLVEDFPIRRVSDKNYTLKIRAEIESPTVPERTSSEKTVSVASLETKIRGLTTIDARAYFRDAPSGILNSGEFPPKVNQRTQYTIHWVVRNYATDISKIHLSAFLQSGSVWTGKIKSNTGSEPVYNPASGEVTWDIAAIPATKGVTSDPVEAIFQIEHTPAVNQIGQEVVLLGDTVLRANDEFVHLPIETSDSLLSTSLPDDTTLEGIPRGVVP